LGERPVSAVGDNGGRVGTVGPSNLIAGGELDDHAARITLLRAAARHVGVDGMSQREVTDSISDGLRYGSQRPRSLTAPQPRPADRGNPISNRLSRER